MRVGTARRHSSWSGGFGRSRWRTERRLGACNEGRVDGVEVSVRQNGHVADVQVSMPQQVFVRPGQGNSGNPVLDLLVDSQGIPDALVEPVLEVVHGRGGVIDCGALRVTWTGDIKGCLDTVLAIARGLR